MNAPFTFRHHNHLPAFEGWVDRTFPGVYALNYAHTGHILWGVDGDPLRELVAPVAWWTWPGPRFTYGCKDAPGWDHHYVTFHGAWAEDLVHLKWMPTIAESAFCPISNPDSFCARMQQLLGYLDAQEPERGWPTLLELLQTVRDEQSDLKRMEPKVRRITELIRAIRNDPSNDWNEDSSARACNLSVAHFRRLFRGQAGLPFWKFCCTQRMALAASCLRRGSHSIKEIADICRMPDVYHFSKMFRSQYGQPPARYRRELRNLSLSGG